MPTIRPPSFGTIRHVRKTITFDGTAGNGAVGNVTVFPITGRVLVRDIATFCTADLTEALATATISLGTVSVVSAFISAATATAIDVNEWWLDASPAAGDQRIGPPTSADAANTGRNHAVSENIIFDVPAQAVNGGTLV